MRLLLWFTSIMLLSCGGTKREKISHNVISDSTRHKLIEMRNNTELWALRCDNGGAGLEDAGSSCNTDNSVLWSGLLCASGSEVDCIYVANSQSTNGRWWRSPAHKDDIDSFSRDMSLGVMLYLITKRDQTRATSWLSFIRQNKLKLCLDASDDRCLITPNIWNAMWYTWKGIDLKPSNNMELAHSVEDSWLSLEGKKMTGFRLHLVVIQAWIRKLTGRWTKDAFNVSRNALSRYPSNAFFEYVAGDVSEKAALTTLSRCDGKRPVERSDWQWQRSEQVNSMGWDCIFMANLLLK